MCDLIEYANEIRMRDEAMSEESKAKRYVRLYMAQAERDDEEMSDAESDELDDLWYSMTDAECAFAESLIEERMGR